MFLSTRLLGDNLEYQLKSLPSETSYRTFPKINCRIQSGLSSYPLLSNQHPVHTFTHNFSNLILYVRSSRPDRRMNLSPPHVILTSPTLSAIGGALGGKYDHANRPNVSKPNAWIQGSQLWRWSTRFVSVLYVPCMIQNSVYHTKVTRTEIWTQQHHQGVILLVRVICPQLEAQSLTRWLTYLNLTET
jgi:hypothetical protein